MGKLGKNSMKGKKAWRKLSAEDIEDFHQQSTKDAITGASLAAAPSDSLFFLDKSTGDGYNKRKKVRPSVIPAVEVEPPGCSFNPEPESHKDSLALAVADEMKKIYKSELGPQPVPLIIEGEAFTEEDRYFIEADDGVEDEIDEDNDVNGEDVTFEVRTVKTKRVTRVELNRRARREQQLRAEAETKKIQQLSKQIDSISDIMEIEEEDKEKAKQHLRCIIAKQERLKSCPPCLGKRKFEPAPIEVLLSEEITGSLRQLKGCCTLARDQGPV